MEKALFTAYSGGASAADLEKLEEMHRADPDDRDLLDWLAFSHYSARSNARARELYRLLIAQCPQEASYHYYLGNLCYRLGDLPAAKAAWTACLACPDGRQFEARVKPRLALDRLGIETP